MGRAWARNIGLKAGSMELDAGQSKRATTGLTVKPCARESHVRCGACISSTNPSMLPLSLFTLITCTCTWWNGTDVNLNLQGTDVKLQYKGTYGGTHAKRNTFRWTRTVLHSGEGFTADLHHCFALLLSTQN